MPQLKSSTALTTTHHTSTARSYGRGRRVTTFTAPAPAKTDSARDLVAAIYAWGRIAVPVTEPDPCSVAWCVNCLGPATLGETFEECSTNHQSATAPVETLSFNDRQADEPDHDEDRIITVSVERCDLPEGGTDEPTETHLYLGRRLHLGLGPAKAREFVAALHKARTSAVALELRDGIGDGDTGAVSVLRCGIENIQVGALFTSDGAVVFVNVVEVLSAADVRSVARRETPHMFPPDSWDLTPAAADQLAEAVAAGAMLAAADRAAVSA